MNLLVLLKGALLLSRQGHSSYITHLDWSPDNNFIMSNSGDYEILYCESAAPPCPFSFSNCG